MPKSRRRFQAITFTSWTFRALSLVIAAALNGCGPSPEELKTVDYTPLPENDLKISTPEEQELDSLLLARVYYEAEKLETLYGLLVIKNGYLLAEKYFNEGSIDQISGRQSTTKSFTSALVGIALERGCIQSLDQKMMDFFPEFADEIKDPRKKQITIRHLLQMRGGYPDEERTSPLFEVMFFQGTRRLGPHLVDFPLKSDPGTKFHYSNLTSHLLGIIVARACDTDLVTFSKRHLFSPMNAEVRGWQVDDDGYYWGCGEIYVTARDMAKFGLLFSTVVSMTARGSSPPSGWMLLFNGIRRTSSAVGSRPDMDPFMIVGTATNGGRRRVETTIPGMDRATGATTSSCSTIWIWSSSPRPIRCTTNGTMIHGSMKGRSTNWWGGS